MGVCKSSHEKGYQTENEKESEKERVTQVRVATSSHPTTLFLILSPLGLPTLHSPPLFISCPGAPPPPMISHS